MPKLYFGAKGGVYYRKGGRKVYVDRSNFGGVDDCKKERKVYHLYGKDDETDEEYLNRIIGCSGINNEQDFKNFLRNSIFNEYTTDDFINLLWTYIKEVKTHYSQYEINVPDDISIFRNLLMITEHKDGIKLNDYGKFIEGIVNKIPITKSKFGGSSSSKVSIDREIYLKEQLEDLPERVIIHIPTTDGKIYIAVKNSFSDYEGGIHKWTSIYYMGKFVNGELVGDVKRIGNVKTFIKSLGKSVGIVNVKNSEIKLEELSDIERMENNYLHAREISILQELNS